MSRTALLVILGVLLLSTAAHSTVQAADWCNLDGGSPVGGQLVVQLPFGELSALAVLAVVAVTAGLVGWRVGARGAHKRVAQAVRESKRRYRAIVEDQTELICRWLPGGVHTFVNEAYCRCFGREHHELIGQSLMTLIPEEDHPRVLKHFASLSLEQPVATHEHRVLVPSGEVRWHQWTDRAIFGTEGKIVEYQSVGRDITERKLAELALKQSEERWRTLFEAAPDAILILDLDGNIQHINRVAPEHRLEDVVGSSALEYVPAEDRERARACFDEVLRTGEYGSVEVRAPALTGGFAWYATRVAPFLQDGKTVGLTVMTADITKLKESEEALRESNERFRALTESTSDWVWETDAEGRYTYASPRVKDLLGYDAEEVLGKTPFDLMPPEEAQCKRAEFAAAAESRQPLVGMENINRHKDGWTVVLETSGVPFFGSDGQFCGYRGIDRDITSRKQAEQKLRDSEELFRTVVDASKDAMIAIGPDGLVTIFNPAAEDMFGCNKDRMVGRDLDCLMPERYRQLHRSYLEGYFARGEPHEAIDRTIELTGVRAGGEEFPIELSLSTGRRAGQRFALAVIRDITERKEAEAALAEAHEKLEQRVKDRTADLTAANRQLEEEIAERKRAQERLWLLSSAVEQTSDGIAVGDHQGNLLFANDAAAAMHGLDAATLTGTHLSVFHTPEQMPSVESANRQLIEEGGFVGEIWHARSDGSTFPTLMHNSLLRDENGVTVGLIGTMRDITEIKQTEAELERSRDYLQTIIDAIADPVLVVDRECRIVLANRLVRDLAGQDPVAAGLTCHQVMRDHETSCAMTGADCPLERIKRTKSKLTVMHNHPDRDGKERHAETTAYPILDEDGEVTQIVQYYRDVTDRARAEAALRQSEERFRTLFENAPVGIYRTTPDGQIESANPALLKMLGCSSFDELTDWNLEASSVGPTYPRGEFRRRIERDGMVVGMEAAWRRQDGRIIHVRENATAVLGDDGKVVYYDGTVEDITERKRADEALREREAALRDFFENANDLIMIVHADGRLEFANRAWRETLGYTEEEMAGLSILDVIHADHRGQCTETFQTVLQGESVSSLELAFVARDGHSVIVEGNCNCRLEHGKPVAIRGIFRDVTERRRAEDQLRRERDFNQALIQGSPALLVAIDAQGRVIMMNDAMLNALGYTSAEVVGADYLPTFVSKADRAKLAKLFDSLTVRPEPGVNENRVVAKDGRELLVEWHGRPILEEDGSLDFFFGMGIDITERQQAERALRQNENLLRKVIDSSPNFIFLKDSQGKFLLVNQRMAEAHETTPQNMVGKTDWDFLGQSIATREEVERFRQDDLEVIQTKRPKVTPDEMFVRVDGSIRWHQATKIPLAVRDDPDCVLGVAVDITDRKRAENALRDRIEFDALITAVSTRFINLPADAVDQGIDYALQQIGEFADVDRGYVFEFSENATSMSNTHEWCAEGIEPFIDELQNVPIEELPWFMDHMWRGEVFHVPSVANLPPEAKADRQHFEWQEIRSLVVVPMICEEKLIGFVGFDLVRAEKMWSEEIVALLRIVGDIFANALVRKLVHQALQASEQKYRSLIENIPDVAWTAARDGSTVFISPNIEKICGFTPQEVYQAGPQLSMNRIHPEDVAQVQEAYRALFDEGRPLDVEYRLQHKNGTWVWLHDRAARPYERGDTTCVDGVVSDITERKHAEALLRRADRLAALGTMVAGVAHELNNPLTSVCGLGELLAKNRSLTTNGREAANEIVEQALRCRRIVQDLLGFARARQVSPQVVQINSLLKRCLDLARRTRRFDDVKITEELDPDLPETMADPYRLEQVVINIIRNAGDVLKRKESARRLTVHSSVEGDRIRIEFADNGPGIADPSRVFDPFYTTTTTGEGTGLGLSVSLGIIHDHGGTITAENTESGAKFTVTLPIHSTPSS